MGTLGTFDAFTTSRLGIYAAMQGLTVTGNNISNINTAGYTRQRIDQVSLKTGGNDRYASMLDNHIGNGTLVSGVSQIRDPYLDIRFRNTSSDVGYTDTMLSGLQEVASILDEIGRGGDSEETYGDGLIYAQIQDLAEKLRAFSADPSKDNETLVRGSAQALTTLFNNYAGRLEKLHQDVEKSFNQDITDVNEILISIRDLNQSIREYEIHGDKALELRDERNRQIDALSEYMNIKVEYTMEDVGAGIQVEKLSIYLADNNPDPNVETDSSMLVDGLFATQLSVPAQKPVLNPYTSMTDDELAALDPQPDEGSYEDLQGYLFVAKVDELPADADKVDYDYVKVTDADGTYYLIGTNDPEAEGVIKEDNDNYTIQLGKLLDRNGKEWETSTTTWAAAEGGTAGVKAVYSFKLTSSDWEDGDQLKIGSQDYEVGKGGLTKTIANDPAKMAAFIASELTKQGSADYTITSKVDNDGNAYIVYTAKKAGAIGSQGPAAAANPTVVNGGATFSITADTANNVPGEDAVPPDESDAGLTIDPFTGNKTTVAYTQNSSGDWFRIQVDTQYTREVALDDNDLYGSLQAQRELLTEEGEFSSDKDLMIDENAAIKRGIPYYQQSFDLLAQKFAEAYNNLNFGYALNQNGNYIDADGKELILPGADGIDATINRYTGLTALQAENLINNGYFIEDAEGNKTADLDRWLDENGGVAMGGALFSNRNDGDDTTGITASNISISYSWSHGAVQIVPKFEVLFGGDLEHTTQNTNADHMVTMIDQALAYNPSDLTGSDATGPLLFTGSFNDMLANMMGVLGEDEHILNTNLNLYYTTYVQLDSARESVSGVDLNDEAMNMMQYQKAYSAACRLMTVIDSVLDRLINNTGVTV